MRLPGLAACGSVSQSIRFSGVLGAMPPPRVSRLARCARLGPFPELGAVAATVWQSAHFLVWNRRAPSAAIPVGVGRRCGLPDQPGLEVWLGFGDHAEAHPGMLARRKIPSMCRSSRRASRPPARCSPSGRGRRPSCAPARAPRNRESRRPDSMRARSRREVGMWMSQGTTTPLG